MDIFLLEAILNGILLGGVLALLALGLNLIFGVVDVVWIAYAELVMCGMYAIYWLYACYGWPFIARVRALAILFVAAARRVRASADHRAGARLARRSTSCWRPAACCSSCRASRRCCSAPISAISASACRSSRSARSSSASRGCSPSSWRCWARARSICS